MNKRPYLVSKVSMTLQRTHRKGLTSYGRGVESKEGDEAERGMKQEGMKQSQRIAVFGCSLVPYTRSSSFPTTFITLLYGT